MSLVVAYEAPPSEQYPIEQTLRSAAKRPLVLLTADGEPFARRGDCVAEAVTLDQVPRHLIDALLAMEDRRFYSHFGIDPEGLLRAAKRNFEAGAIREGGSTITQQLAKNSYLSNERTLDRKLEEALLAMWLEVQLTKDQILERYLNSVYFGEGCFGARAAARHFFDKPVGELNVSESTLLVALLRAPTRLNKNFDEARQRARLVLRAMVRDGRLDAAQLVGIQPAGLDTARANEFGAYYADWLATSLQREMQAPHSRQPILVHSTFDPALQRIAEKAVQSVLEKEGGKRNAGQAALVAMRTDGRVVAMVGGKAWATSRFNRAVQARRQPGSSFKMFVYLAALRAGAKVDMVVADEPLSIAGWEPQNFGGGYRGDVALAEAFALSINTIAVKVSEAVGRDAVIATARDLGIASPMAPNPSLALGTSEVSLLELTAAYAAIAAGAYPVLPWAVAGLDGAPAEGGAPPRNAGLWKLAEADSMREFLSHVVRNGSGRAARLPIPAFGKTGTSQQYRDAWFIGFAGNLVVGIWVGNDDDTPMKGVTGSDLPVQIWHAFMGKALESDTGFERRLPKIAAFEARDPKSVDRSSRLAALEDIVIVAAVPPATASTRSADVPVARRSSTMSNASLLGREALRGRNDPSPRAAERANRSSDFNRQLRDMGWPGN